MRGDAGTSHAAGEGDERAPGDRWSWRRPWRRAATVPRGGAEGRTLYDNPIEWEAETVATILLSWVPGFGGYVAEPAAHEPLEDALGDEGAW